MRDLANVEVLRSEFDAFQVLFKFDHRFPRTWEGWRELLALALEQARQFGDSLPVPLLIVPADFEAWCQRVELAADIDALRAYVILERKRAALLASRKHAGA